MVATSYTSEYESRAMRNRAFRQIVDLAESLLFFVLLIYFSGAIVGVLFIDPLQPDVENPMARLLWYPVYLLAAGLAVRSIVNVTRLAAFTPILIICVLYCGVSMLWSIDPPVSLRRAIALMMTTLMGLALAGRYGWGAMVQLIAAAYAFLAFFSIFVALAMPAKGVMPIIYPGAWSGPWIEKNYLGGHMTRGLIAAMCAFAMRPSRFWIWIPAGMAAFFCTLMSQSKTALLVSVAAIGGFILLRLFRRYAVLRVPLLYICVMGASIFVFLLLTIPEEMFGLIGKDPSLTGRTDIWEALMRSIRERYTLGYGYGVYWQDQLGPSYYVRQQLEWGVPTAHNGWIETWLSGGIILVALFGLHSIITLLLAVGRIGRGGVETYWVILSTLCFFAFSMSESTILAQNDISWVLFVATSAKLFAGERPFWRPGTR